MTLLRRRPARQEIAIVLRNPTAPAEGVSDKSKHRGRRLHAAWASAVGLRPGLRRVSTAVTSAGTQVPWSRASDPIVGQGTGRRRSSRRSWGRRTRSLLGSRSRRQAERGRFRERGLAGPWRQPRNRGCERREQRDVDERHTDLTPMSHSSPIGIAKKLVAHVVRRIQARRPGRCRSRDQASMLAARRRSGFSRRNPSRAISGSITALSSCGRKRPRRSR